MFVTRSYSVKIVNENKEIAKTIELYQNCVSDLINVFSAEYEEFKDLPNLEAKMYCEHLIHKTDDNDPKYHFFDKRYYKLPSYLRRSAIADALASVKAYKNATTEKKTLNRHPNTTPCLYRGNMFKMFDETHAEIKLYINNDWLWKTVELRKSDLNYLKKNNLKIEDSCAPVLKKCGRRFKLVFCFRELVELKDKIDTVCAVDLGINHDAVCSIICKDGAVKARRFIKCAEEKDQLYRILGQISYRQSIGLKQNKKFWRFANNQNKEISITTAKAIVEFAKENNADCIVFEHLDAKGKKKGSRKQRLHLWRKADIQKRCENLAHQLGMRISRVCAINSSKLAFDGSGKVLRDKDNYSLCTFSNGKRYNCDLSASYNIGARYFIRELLNPLSEKVRLALQAKFLKALSEAHAHLTLSLRFMRLSNSLRFRSTEFSAYQY